MKADVAALQARLREAKLDDSLPSETSDPNLAGSESISSGSGAAEEPPKAAAAAAAAKPTPAGTVKTPHIPSYLSESDDEDEKPPPEDVDMDAVAKVKSEGNEYFRTQQYKDAVASYMTAIRMLQKGDLVDAKLFSNMAAAQLALDKFVAAAMYGQRCTEADPDWWKGHWYRGQALMKMLRNKPPSTAMSERCEQAKHAFEGCLKCSTLPASKRAQVEEELQTCKNALMQITGCGQQ